MSGLLTDDDLSYGVPEPRRAPSCNPCRDGDHHRCPTAITEHGQGSFSSTFDCPCYATDEAMHAEAVEESDREFYGERDHHFGRADWDPDGRRHYENWLEEL